MQNSVYEKTIAQLSQKGIDSPRLEARILIADILHIDPNTVNFETKLDKTQYEELSKNIEKRRNGAPLDKILGRKAFYKYEFKVSDDVLSPRPDTEILVENAIDIIKKEKLKTILDLGTGSGCILLSILKEAETLKGVGVDVSDKALKIARENAQILGLQDRCSFINKSWNNTDFLKNFLDPFDMLVSNPPYIKTDEIETLAAEVKTHDPILALDGGKDGLDAYRRIAQISSELLHEGGYILLEVGAGQAVAVRHIFETEGLSYLKTLPDLSGIERVIVLKK